jgi:hypothetical protein
LKAQGKVVLFTAIKHNLWTKSRAQKIKQHREGLRKGFPDLVIIINTPAGRRMILIEMKQIEDGKLSPFQTEWLSQLNYCAGVKAFCAHGYEEAKLFIDSEIKG